MDVRCSAWHLTQADAELLSLSSSLSLLGACAAPHVLPIASEQRRAIMRNKGPWESNQTPEAARSPARLEVAALHRAVTCPAPNDSSRGFSFACQRNSMESQPLTEVAKPKESGKLGQYSCICPLHATACLPRDSELIWEIPIPPFCKIFSL